MIGWKKKSGQARIAIAFMIILLASGSIVIAQNISEANQTANTTVDPCGETVCEVSTTVCADGSVATCDNACNPSNGQCTNCAPDCVPLADNVTSNSNPDQNQTDGAGSTGPGPAPASSTNETGSVDTEGTVDTNDTISSINDIAINNATGTKLLNETNTTQQLTNETGPVNETIETVNETSPISNDTASAINDTAAGNETSKIPEEPVNETDEGNKTTEEQVPPDSGDRETVQGMAELSVDISHPQRITRGETAHITATITNSGNGDANNIDIAWKLSDGLSSALEQDNCKDLKPGSSCAAELTAESSISTQLGGNSIGIVLNYE